MDDCGVMVVYAGTAAGAANRSGKVIDGGLRRTLSKGDVALVPEGVPHWFTDINGTLVLLSMHLPRRAGQ